MRLIARAIVCVPLLIPVLAQAIDLQPNDKTFTAGASYFYVSGGGTTTNGISQNNEIKTQRFLLGLHAYTDVGRFSLQYGRDMETVNGFEQTRVLAFRYMRSF